MFKGLLVFVGFWLQVICSPLLLFSNAPTQNGFIPLIRSNEDGQGKAAQYYLSSHNTTWLNAKRECESSQMSLLAITSPTIQAQVEFELNYVDISADFFYTSGNDAQTEGLPVWGDGSRFIYENEYFGENTEDTDCMGIYREEGNSLWKWHFVPCSDKHQFICQVVADFEDELERLKKELDIVKTTVINLQRNPVPIGYTYNQLEDEYSPLLLWPQVEWEQVNGNHSDTHSEKQTSSATWKRIA